MVTTYFTKYLYQRSISKEVYCKFVDVCAQYIQPYGDCTHSKHHKTTDSLLEKTPDTMQSLKSSYLYLIFKSEYHLRILKMTLLIPILTDVSFLNALIFHLLR